MESTIASSDLAADIEQKHPKYEMPAVNGELKSLDFVSSLPPNTPEYIGSTAAGIKKKIDEEKAKDSPPAYIIFTNVMPGVVESKAFKEIRGIRIHYDAGLLKLIITLPGLPHENAAKILSHRVLMMTEDMGIMDGLAVHGEGLFQIEIDNHKVSKEPDASFAPYEVPADRKEWPTMIVECGWLESMPQLRRDAALWIENFDCKVAIIISISRNRHKIIIEKWIPEPEQPGVQTRASLARVGQPVISGAAITIAETNGVITVQNDPLVIRFDELWLRPISEPNEHDYIIHRQYLEDLGRRVWRAKGISRRLNARPSS